MSICKILLPCLFIFVITSCQKQIDNPDPNPTVPPAIDRVKTYTEDYTASSGHYVNTYNLSYDANGRITSLVSSTSPGDKFVYTYSTGSFTLDLYNSNLLSIHELLFLNGNAFIDSTIADNGPGDSTSEKYQYNAAKQLIKLTLYSILGGVRTVEDVSNYSYDNSGNLIRDVSQYSVTTYDYYPNLMNPVLFLHPFLPGPKLLIKTTTNTNGGTVVVLNHSYTFDSNNRLSTEKVVADNGEILIRTYTY